jgi:hypothetical protein
VSRARAATLALSIALALIAVSGSSGGEVPHVTARVTTNQLVATLTVDPASTEQGRTVKARATVTNTGAHALTAVSATLRLDSTGLIPASTPTVTLGTLAPQGSATVTWQICGGQPGLYVLLAQARATRADGYELVTESEAKVLTVSPGRARCR